MSSNLIQFQLGPNVVLVCSRRVCGPSPLHGTIVNNVETDRSKQAFNTRVGLTVPLNIFLFNFHLLVSSSQYRSHFHFMVIFHGTIVKKKDRSKQAVKTRKGVFDRSSQYLPLSLSGVTLWCHSLLSLSGVTF